MGAVEAREEEKKASNRSNGGRADKRSNGGKASKGSNRRKKEWKDGSGGEEDEHGRREGTDRQGREREGKSENCTGKEDWEHSLERRRVDDIRQ